MTDSYSGASDWGCGDTCGSTITRVRHAVRLPETHLVQNFDTPDLKLAHPRPRHSLEPDSSNGRKHDSSNERLQNQVT